MGLGRQFDASNEVVGAGSEFDHLTQAQPHFLRSLASVPLDLIETEAIDLFGIDLFHKTQAYRIYSGDLAVVTFAFLPFR